MNILQVITTSTTLAVLLLMFDNNAQDTLHFPHKPTSTVKENTPIKKDRRYQQQKTSPVKSLEKDSQEKIEEESSAHQDEDNTWTWNYWCKQSEKVLFATTVVAGTVAVTAAAGGVAGMAAAACGGTQVAVGAQVGAVIGGSIGAGYGTNLAVKEFNKEDHSTTATAASTVGKVALATAAASLVVGSPAAAQVVESTTIFGIKATQLIGPAAKLFGFATGYAAAEATEKK